MDLPEIIRLPYLADHGWTAEDIRRLGVPEYADGDGPYWLGKDLVAYLPLPEGRADQ